MMTTCENHQPMTDTTDLREQVARAIAEFNEGNRLLLRDDYIARMADAALAVAEPIIRADERRKVIEELAQKAEEHGYWVMSHSPNVQTKRASIWLRAQQENADHD